MSDSRSEELRLELRAIWDAVLDSHGYAGIEEVPAEKLEGVWDEIQGEIENHPESKGLTGLLTTLSGMTSSYGSDASRS
jgi:hypothetical protein